ncbi:MAG: hypothetical protein U0X91_22230 [Spirosomataceae bacterium]
MCKGYEIARLDYKREKHPDNVTAAYSLKDNADIRADIKGERKMGKSIGKIKPVTDPEEAQ